MTLPQNVKDAVESLECEIADPEDCTAWQTIRAHLLSQDAEIERLTRENGTMRRALETLDAIGHKRAELAESHLVLTNDLLIKFANAVESTAFKMPPPNAWTPVFVELAQEAKRQLNSLAGWGFDTGEAE